MRVHVLLAALLGAFPSFVSTTVLGAEPSHKLAATVGKKSPVIELEKEDDPPGKYVARDNPLARSPRPTVVFGPYQSIQVNVDALGHNIVGDAANEPSIAVNPMNPMNMVIGWRQFDTVTSNFRTAGWAYTANGGQTWTFPGVLQPGVFRSDPVLDVDAQGNFYYQSLKSNFTADVYKSTNGGVSWLAPVTEFGGDKNWLVVDRSGGASSGQIYGIWQRFSACCGANVLTRSTNGGASFQNPVAVTNSPTFGILAVGPNGELYATGIDGSVTQDFNHFVVAKSTNAGNPTVTPTFTGGRVNLGGSMQFSAGPNPEGLLGQANIAVDSSTGATRGNVYVAASVSAGDPADANFIRSTDGGATWSAPVRVNDDDPSQSNWQWFAAHSVAHNGRIDMIWNDSRGSGQPNLSQLYYAYSWDGGTTWSPNVAVSPVFDSLVGFPNQNKIGDYSGIVSNDTGADVAYAATFNNEQDIYYVRVFPDCNANGVSDVTDLAGATSLDCDSNHIPDECQPAVVCGPSLIYGSSTPADSCPAGGTGVGNGAVDPGEDVGLSVSLVNDGTVNLTNVSATLSTSTPRVTVTRAAATYPDLPTHGAAPSNAPSFAFTVDAGVSCGTNIDFTIAATAAQGSWTRAFSVRVGAQGTTTSTYTSGDVPKTIADFSTVTSTLTVPATTSVLDVDVSLSITHTFDGDLVLVLIGPNGTRILLANGLINGVNYTGTIFDDEAAASITTGTAPFTGRFGPMQPLSSLDGIPANGTWRLEVQDVAAGDTGTLDAWSLTPTVAAGFVCSACTVSAPVLEPVAVTWSPGSPTSIQWEPIAGATFYEVYRGEPADLPNLLNSVSDSCRRTATTGTSTGNVLQETPPAGSFYWYLVRAANGGGQGPAGNATAGPRSQESTGECP